MFALMPSQEGKEDEDEDEEPPAEKAKTKSPEEGNRPPSELARHDVIKVQARGQLAAPSPVTSRASPCWEEEGSSRPGAQLHLAGGLCLNLRGFWLPTCCLGCATYWR